MARKEQSILSSMNLESRLPALSAQHQQESIFTRKALQGVKEYKQTLEPRITLLFCQTATRTIFSMP
jgi:hypothetical protein